MAAVPGHQPPPFFRRGLPPSAKLTIYLALSLALIVGDLRLRYLETLRQGVAILTYPLQIAAATPAEFVRNASNYFNGLVGLQRENQQLRAEQLEAATSLLRQSQLEQENARLRGLLEMRDRVGVHAVAAEVLFTARDPFSRRVILDKGGNQGVEAGLAVVDPDGVIGQVTRVYPLHAEVTLLSDKDQAIPVVIERSGLRAVMFGTGTGLMELRYLAANADVQTGDRILTSGLDGVFVPGLPVATVVRVSRDNAESFARILCKPLGGVETNGSVLVLGRAGALPQRPVEEKVETKRSGTGRIVAGASEPNTATAAPPQVSAPPATSAPAVRPAPRTASAPPARPAASAPTPAASPVASTPAPSR